MNPKEPDLLEEAVKEGACSEELAKLLRKRLSKLLEPVGHPSTVLDTEDWQLTAVVKFVPKTRQVPCPGCNGSGRRQAGFGFGLDDDPNDDRCQRCLGHGTITYHPDEATRPPVPEDLLKRLHEVWKAYFAEHDDKSKWAAIVEESNRVCMTDEDIAKHSKPMTEEEMIAAAVANTERARDVEGKCS